MFAMAKLMEMETTEQNKVALYLFNKLKSYNKNAPTRGNSLCWCIYYHISPF